MKKLLILLMILFSPVVVFTQEEDDFFSEDIDFDDMDLDSMFSDEEEFVEEVEDQSDEVMEASSELLTTEGVEFGGSYSASIGAGLTYSKLDKFEGLWDKDYYDDTFSPSIDASLHFNARPTEDLRFFGKVKTSIPFYKSAKVFVPTDNPLTDEEEEDPSAQKVSIPDIYIYELFNDFNYDKKVYFRVGKQNAKWGVGYFFSPADFLSLQAIDPEDPEADREGPIAVKVSAPFGLNNIFAYITVPDTIFDDPDNASADDLILAPLFQALVGDVEISTGIYYQKDSAKRGMVSATYGTNSNAGKFSFFGEAVGLYGSDKVFIKDDYTTQKIDDEFFFNGTVGLTWNKEIKDNNFSLALQYLYNGEGYDKDDNAADTEVLYGYVISKEISKSDAFYRHKHYMGGNFSIKDLFANEDLSISVFTMLNLVDISGYVKPSVTYEFFDELSTTFSTNFNVSDEGDEFFSDRLGFELTFNLGGGDF